MRSYLILLIFMCGSLAPGDCKYPLLNWAKCELSKVNYVFFNKETPNINYLLYTRQNPHEPCDLQPTLDAVVKCKYYNPSLQTKVMIHGWIGGLPPESFFFPMKDAILAADDFNVVIVNWTAYTQNTEQSYLGYSTSAVYSLYVGRKVSAWVYFLQFNVAADPKKFHFIPFSMGSEVTSFAAKTTCNIGHITYLDPAAPNYRYLPPYFGPSPIDADFVEAMHTDAATNVLEGFGFKRPVADIDYYPNGGNMQPKCNEGDSFVYADGTRDTVHDRSTSISCKHNSAFLYYLASFNKSCKFLGLICKDYDDYTSGECSPENAQSCEMGYYSQKIKSLPVNSKCYMKTSDHAPFCLN